MRRHAKASSAGSTSSRGKGLGSSSRGAFAIRDASGDATGSGAPAARGRLALLALPLAAFALLAFAPFSQAKGVISGFGTQATFIPGVGAGLSPGYGGEFGEAAGIAVNNSGAGGVAPGTTYVVDAGQNRVQRFSAAGAFERAWGQNVLGRDERQLIKVSTGQQSPLSGSFALTFAGETVTFNVTQPSSNSTNLLPSSSTIQRRLEALPSIGAGNVQVFGGLNTYTGAGGTGGGPILIRFVGALGGTNVPQLLLNTSQLVGTPPLSASIETVEDGSGGPFAGFEICTVATNCKNGEVTGNTANGGQIDSPQGIAVNQASGHVYVTEANNRRVSEFDANGNFIRVWGWDVVMSGKPGDVPGTSEQQSVTLGGNTTGGKFSLSFGGQSTGAQGFVTTTSGSNILNQPTTRFSVGQIITGPGIPNNTSIIAVDPDGAFITISAPATASTGGSFVSVSADNIAWDVSPAAVQAELEALPTIGAGNVSVTSGNPGGGVVGGPYTVTFQNALADADVSQLGSSAAGLQVSSGSKTATVSTTVPGKVGGFEICNVAADCKEAAAAGADGGRFGGTIGYPVTDSANNVWVPDATNRRLQEFDSSGNFVAAYGYNVDKLGGAGALETCTSTAIGACQAGTSGTTPGQFTSGSPRKMAFDSAGNVYALAAGSNRVQKFNPTLTSATEFAQGTFPAFTDTAPTEVISTQGGTRLVFAIFNDVTASERQLLEIDPADASVKGSSLVGAKLGEVSALAEDTATGNLQMTTNSEASPTKVLTLSSTPIPDPVLVLNPITTKTDTSATFAGTVDPKGGWVRCTFQYSTDQVTWTDVAEPDCASLALNGGSQAISQSVTGLNPVSHYFVRLSVSRPLAAVAAKLTPTQEFDTNGSAPIVSHIGVTQVNDTSVRLLGTIDPRNSDTEYSFQYGTTPGLGSATVPVDIGSGNTPLLVSQLVNGLSPGTTYHFRLVATNPVGSTPSSTQTFSTRAQPLPPSNRAYEQVSPPDKNFGGVDISPLFTAGNSPDGEAAGFCTGTGLSTDPPGQVTGACSNYISHRSASGWLTRGTGGPICSSWSFNGVLAIPSLYFNYALVGMPLQGDFCPNQPLDPAAPTTGQGFAFYRQDMLTQPSQFHLVAPLPTPLTPYVGATTPASSDDASHIVFASEAQQTPGAPAGSFKKIFDWHEGDLTLASKDTANQPFTTSSHLVEDGVNGVSASGDRIFFQNPTSGGEAAGSGCINEACEIYMREDATTTKWVSEQECTVACPNTSAPDIFEMANSDGSRVTFHTNAKLIDGDTQGGTDLYLYTDSVHPATDQNLTLLSKDNEPADGTIADVQGVLGMSEDGETVYFVANGQLVAGQPTAAGPKVYRWHRNGAGATIEYLATLLPGSQVGGDERLWSALAERPLISLVTPDGRHLVVETRVQIDPVLDRDNSRDVYRWGVNEGWACVSCQEPGVPSAGDSKIDGTDLTGFGSIAGIGMMNQQLRIVMSDDGQRVFFSSRDALVPADSNGTVYDVYEWHDGTINMISNGLDKKEPLLIGASSSGRDVFFITYERLVGWDTDTGSDVYDARIGGGFPEPPPTGAPCEGEACRGASSAPPATTGAGTAVFQGAGNSPSKNQRCAKGKVRHHGKVRRHGKCAKKHTKPRARQAKGRASR